MKRNLLTVAALLIALCVPLAAHARPSGHRDHRRPVIVSPFLRPRVRTPVIVPWNLRTHREYGWIYGMHGGYHWAPGVGWHNLLHHGYYRVDDGRVFVPVPGDWRSRGRF